MLADETEHVQSQQSVCLSLLLQALRLEQTAHKNLNIEVEAIKFHSADNLLFLRNNNTSLPQSSLN